MIARMLGVDASKITALIKRGELEASNVAMNPLGRPRFRVSPEALQRFLQRRSTVPAPAPTRARRKSGTYVPKYFQ
jgi:hypothetical protein